MGRGLSDLQKRILIEVHRLERPICSPADLRADIRDVARHIHGNGAKLAANRAVFSRAVSRLQERGLLTRCYPGLSRNGNPQALWLVLTDEARTAYRLAPNHADTALTDRRTKTSWQVFPDARCKVCGQRFELSEETQPELYGDDGRRIGSVCPECFKALQAGGAAALATRLGMVADEILQSGQCMHARAAELAKTEIRIEVENRLPDDPTAGMILNAENMLAQYIGLRRWEIDVAVPEGIEYAWELYPDPWRQWAELFSGRWQAGTCPDTLPMICISSFGDMDERRQTAREWHDKNDPTRRGLWLDDESLGFEITAIDTPEAVILIDEYRDGGYIRIPKKTECETAPGTNELATV